MSNAVLSSSQGWTLGPLSKPVRADRVRIKVAMAGLCRTDIQAMRRERVVAPGLVLGHEAAGQIAEIPIYLLSQALERGLEVGDRVAFFPFLPCGKCSHCESGGAIEQCHAPSAIGIDEDGAFGTFVDLPLSVIFRAPSKLSWKHLAYAEPVSASMAVIDIPELMHGTRVGVVGTGRIAQLTLAVLNAYRDSPAEHLDPNAQSYGGAFDAIVETRATEDLLRRATRALRPGGTLVVKSRPSNAVPWPHQEIVLRRLRVVGAPYGSFQAGLDAMASGKISVDHMLGPSFALTQEGIEEALALEDAGQEMHGKLFFEISDFNGLEPG